MMTPRATARYNPSTPKLSVALRDKPTGTVGESGTDLWYAYDPALVQVDDGDVLSPRAISVRMPVVDAPYGHAATLVFFDKLLLESDTRAEGHHQLAPFYDIVSTDVGVKCPVLHRLSWWRVSAPWP